MTAMLDPRYVPKYLLDRPEFRARRLKVYPNGPKAYLVPNDKEDGKERIYDVFLVGGVIRCTCQAANHGRLCAHALAVGLYLAKQKGDNP